jgi:hypothetical protein
LDRVAWTAGASPISSPLAKATANVKAMTLKSSSISNSNGMMNGGIIASVRWSRTVHLNAEAIGGIAVSMPDGALSSLTHVPLGGVRPRAAIS